MDTATLEDYLALNEQLAALVEAGVPLDVGLADPAQPVAQALERINATVARRVGRGESLYEALDDDDQDLPPSYRSLVELGFHTGDLSAALEGSTRVAESADASRRTLESAFLYPLVVCFLVYLGLIGLCLYLVPSLENMYANLELPHGPGLRVLEALRDTLPYWAVILPVVVIGFVAWRVYLRSQCRAAGMPMGGIVDWLPGVSKTMSQVRCARFAETLSELLDGGTPFDESLRIAADGSGIPALREAGRQLAAAAKAGEFPNDTSANARRFPPFLRWAIWHSEETTGRARALEIAAEMYRETADRRSEKLRTVAPMIALILLGGTFTLLYALAMFVPLVELLRAIAGS